MATPTGKKGGRMADPAADPAKEQDVRAERNPNFIKHGSDQHAMILGLRKAKESDKYVCEGWTLVDITAFGAAARPEFLEAQLAQRVNELKTPPAKPQSDSPRKPNYAPPLWVPPEPVPEG